eukprot:4048333-Amphidinium_carterae.1
MELGQALRVRGTSAYDVKAAVLPHLAGRRTRIAIQGLAWHRACTQEASFRAKTKSPPIMKSSVCREKVLKVFSYPPFVSAKVLESTSLRRTQTQTYV